MTSTSKLCFIVHAFLRPKRVDVPVFLSVSLCFTVMHPCFKTFIQKPSVQHPFNHSGGSPFQSQSTPHAALVFPRCPDPCGGRKRLLGRSFSSSLHERFDFGICQDRLGAVQRRQFRKFPPFPAPVIALGVGHSLPMPSIRTRNMQHHPVHGHRVSRSIECRRRRRRRRRRRSFLMLLATAVSYCRRVERYSRHQPNYAPARVRRSPAETPFFRFVAFTVAFVPSLSWEKDRSSGRNKSVSTFLSHHAKNSCALATISGTALRKGGEKTGCFGDMTCFLPTTPGVQ
jgi:hypothetical protein